MHFGLIAKPFDPSMVPVAFEGTIIADSPSVMRSLGEPANHSALCRYTTSAMEDSGGVSTIVLLARRME
jgi:hypothetical protein